MDGDRSVAGDLGKLAAKKVGKFVLGAFKNAQNHYSSAPAYPNQQAAPPLQHQYPSDQAPAYPPDQPYPYAYPPHSHQVPPDDQTHHPHASQSHASQQEPSLHHVQPPGYPSAGGAPGHQVNNIQSSQSSHIPYPGHAHSPQNTPYGTSQSHVPAQGVSAYASQQHPHVLPHGGPGYDPQQQPHQGTSTGSLGYPVAQVQHPQCQPSAPPLEPANPQPHPHAQSQNEYAPSNASSPATAGGKLTSLTGKLNVSGPGGTAQPPAPPGNSGTAGGKLQKGWGEIICQALLMQIHTRPHSARVVLGDTAVLEARKGLSRVLQVGSDGDLELFAQQLRSSDNAACEPDFRECNDKIPCFAISYVHSDRPTGRFKFSVEQWDSFKAACEEIFGSGVKEIRIWLDQCLWLRDASQGAWAHTGLMPYVMWPVISLGVKAAGAEKTLDTDERMWPFVEEVAGLWSLGVIITRELRGKTMDTGSRRWLSFQLRHKCEPEDSMRLLLLNIFHGALDGLQTGWIEDGEELMDMAKWNFLSGTNSVIVGSDWKSRVANLPGRHYLQVIQSLHLSHNVPYLPNPNVYLDKSRRLKSGGSYNGWVEWTSGSGEITTEKDASFLRKCEMSDRRYQIVSDCGEFQILCKGSVGRSIRLLVAMDGLSSNFSRGHVAWTQVLYGRSSCCDLEGRLDSGNKFVISNVLEEMLGRRVQVLLVINRRGAAIEWA